MSKRSVVLAAAASLDVANLLEDALARTGLADAMALNERLDAALESLATLSERGRYVPELRARGITTYREILTGTFRIVYRVEPKEVRVVAVVDHRRDLDELLYARARR